ncbi:MAG TPA: hypothetical protein VH558_08215 [Pseudolabrys sp.]|jgi:hypothetical protein
MSKMNYRKLALRDQMRRYGYESARGDDADALLVASAQRRLSPPPTCRPAPTSHLRRDRLAGGVRR